MQSDTKSLSGFPWTVNVNFDNNLESPCIITYDSSNITVECTALLLHVRESSGSNIGPVTCYPD
jgi:hypothetical protein